MREVKIITFDLKGGYLNHQFKELSPNDSLYKEINSKPRKVWNKVNSSLEYRYITDDLNANKEAVAEKYIIEKHRIYFYVLDSHKQVVELEFSKNLESFLDRLLVSRKLSKHRCLHYFTNHENQVFEFGHYHDSFDKIYYITDVIDDQAAKKAIYDDLEEQAKVIRNDLSFLERMMEVSAVNLVETSADVIEFRNDVPMDDVDMLCPKCGKEFNKANHIDKFIEGDICYRCPSCSSVILEEYIEEIKPIKKKLISFFNKFKKQNKAIE